MILPFALMERMLTQRRRGAKERQSGISSQRHKGTKEQRIGLDSRFRGNDGDSEL